MESTDVLAFAATVLAASVDSAPPKPSGGGRASGPWYRDLPKGSKGISRLVRDFAQAGGMLSVGFGPNAVIAGRIVPPLEALDDGLRATVEFEVPNFDVKEQRSYVLPYPNAAIRNLCGGWWTEFGVGAVKLSEESLLPDVRVEGPNTVIEWQTPPAVRVQLWQRRGVLAMFGRWVARLTTTEIRRLVIVGDSYIDVQAGGMVVNNLLPRLRLN